MDGPFHAGGAVKGSLVLFDIDNTLLNTGGAGRIAMERAFADVFAVDGALAGVEFQGHTDRSVYLHTLGLHGLPDGGADVYQTFVDRYHALLSRYLPLHQGHLKPGVPALLHLLRDAGALLSLQTGNFREGAGQKLEHYGIARHFEGGGFGDNLADRPALVREAMRQFRGRFSGPVYVIGDTPADMISARANGAFAIGVATGEHRRDELTAADADLVFSDMADVAATMAALTALAAPAAR
ncbi:MAG: HAD family hydrolase [Dehalococcoidia bacterium]|nr:HAD family hydrolase [Dehalococcoidia bacterium]